MLVNTSPVVHKYFRKLARRLEELTQDSAALKALLLPQLQALNNEVPELVNFGFSLAQRVMPYLAEVRSSKDPFQLATVLGYVKDCASSSVGKDPKEAPGPESWEAVAAFFAKVVEELNQLITLASEHENVYKSMYFVRCIPSAGLSLSQSRVLRLGSSVLTRSRLLQLSTSKLNARLLNSATRCRGWYAR